MNASETKTPWLWILFAAAIVFVYSFGLTVPLVGPDEPRYSQVAREMFLRGDLVTPTLGGFHWFEKPALLYWLQIATYSIFGVSEFSARFGSALFGLGTIASIWILFRRTVSLTAANYAGLIAATSLGLIVFARGASFDIIVTFPLTAAMVSFFLAEREATRNPTLALVSFYFFIGLAVLAKGLIGFVFPAAIVTLYFLLSWRVPSLKLLVSLVWGPILAILVAATWYLPMYLTNGWAFIDEFFIQHHFQRYTSNKYLHPQPFHFFLWVLPLTVFPWFPFLFAGLWKGVREIMKPAETGVGTQPLFRFAIAWMLVPLVFFSFSGSKLPGYILPATPPAIVIASIFLIRRIEMSGKWRVGVIATGTAMLALVIGLVAFVLPQFAERDSVRSLIMAANSAGHAREKVLMFYHRSHNAEFYATGRLLRSDGEEQRVFYRPEELAAAIEGEAGRTALVIAPLEHLSKLTGDPRLKIEVIRDNTELAIVSVAAK